MSKETPAVAPTPEIRPGFRDTDYVQPVVLRMGTGYVDALDELCAANGRSRRELVEALIVRAIQEFDSNPDSRIPAP